MASANADPAPTIFSSMALDESRKHVSLRIPDADLRRIDQLARHHRLTRTEYLIRASTGQLDDPAEVQERLHDIEFRLLRLEGPTRPTM